MTDVKIFNSPMFGELRVTRNEKGELLFCLKKMCATRLGCKLEQRQNALKLAPLVQLMYQKENTTTPPLVQLT